MDATNRDDMFATAIDVVTRDPGKTAPQFRAEMSGSVREPHLALLEKQLVTMERATADRLLAIESAARDLLAAIGETADDVPVRARPALLALRVACAREG